MLQRTKLQPVHNKNYKKVLKIYKKYRIDLTVQHCFSQRTIAGIIGMYILSKSVRY